MLEKIIQYSLFVPVSVILIGIGLFLGFFAGCYVMSWFAKDKFYSLSNENFELEHRIQELSKTITKYMGGGILDEGTDGESANTNQRIKITSIDRVRIRKDSKAGFG